MESWILNCGIVGSIEQDEDFLCVVKYLDSPAEEKATECFSGAGSGQTHRYRLDCGRNALVRNLVPRSEERQEAERIIATSVLIEASLLLNMETRRSVTL